ncbi:recombinase family protein [Falsiroseomonas sp. HC035]|uniref:recombinase family protein n=1 Tax=Falsiroseomonas sp. HC035 TaxID=3390999 RepID=UPI003D320B01
MNTHTSSHQESGLFLSGHKHNMQIGYILVSDFNKRLQREAFSKVGCKVFFEDYEDSDPTSDLPGLRSALARLGPDDTLVVWKISHLGNSLPHFFEIMRYIDEKHAVLVSITEEIRLDSKNSSEAFKLIRTLAEFDRIKSEDRTRARITAAKLRGRRLGRPRKLNRDQVSYACTAIKNGLMAPTDLAKIFDVNISTLLRSIRRASCADGNELKSCPRS